MTQYRLNLELNDVRTKSESAGVGVSQTLAPRQGPITLAAVANTIVVPPIGVVTRERLQRARLVFRTGGVVDTMAETWRGLPGWFIHAAAGNSFEANGAGDDTIIEWQNAPLMDRRDVLQITGAAATALGNVTGPATLEFSGEVTKTLVTRQSSSALFDAFFDDTIDGLFNNLQTFLERIRKQIVGQGGGLLVLAQQGNNVISINGAAAAFGLGPPIITNTDTGNGFGQIPASPANWSAAAFAAHPRVFYRPSSHLFHIQELQPSPPSAAVELTSDLPLFPLLAARPPTHSLWRVLIEGNILDIVIAHPANSDLRRPRDIWQKVWLPAIASNTLTTYNFFFFGLAPNLVRVFYSVGLLNNVALLDYAYCLDLYDAGGPLIQYPEI